MKTKEYKPADGSAVYVPVPSEGCQGCAFDNGDADEMTEECYAAPGCHEYSENGAVIWVKKEDVAHE